MKWTFRAPLVTTACQVSRGIAWLQRWLWMPLPPFTPSKPRSTPTVIRQWNGPWQDHFQPKPEPFKAVSTLPATQRLRWANIKSTRRWVLTFRPLLLQTLFLNRRGHDLSALRPAGRSRCLRLCRWEALLKESRSPGPQSKMKMIRWSCPPSSATIVNRLM